MKTGSASYTLLFMICICVVFGGAVAVVHYATLEKMAQNDALHRNRIIAYAFDMADESVPPATLQTLIDRRLIPATITGEKGFELLTDRETQRVAFFFSGMGFWDRISGIIVLTPDLSKIVNLRFLDQKETPGLGARIEEPWFTNQFRNLTIDWQAPADRRLVIGAVSQSEVHNRVDAITGASQTSLALNQILNRELELFRQVFTAGRRPN